MDTEITKPDLSGLTDSFIITNPTLRRMHEEADGIQAYLDNKADLDNYALLPYRLNDLDAYFARVSDMQVRAKAMKEYAKIQFLTCNETKLSNMTATASNRLLSSFLYEFTVTEDRLDALCGALSGACRNLVTQISYIKKTMELGG